MTQREHPIILGLVSNLMLSTRIEAAAASLGYEVDWLENEEQLGPALGLVDESPRRQLAEHTEGRGAELLDRITRMRPALIIFDLGNEQIQWQRWLALVKSVPATRRIPVVAFGPHVDTEALESAKERGADGVFPRSRFLKQIDQIISEYAAPTDYAALRDACQASLSELAIKGLELFNRQEYFEAHEELELAWNEDETVGRELYRGILQIAVAYLQIQRKNYRGAYKMFLRARQWLDPLPDTCRGVDVARLRADAKAVRRQLLELGPDDLEDFDTSLFNKVSYSLRAGLE